MGALDNKLVNYQSLKENTKLTLNEALAYDKGLAGGYGGDFPLSAASKDSIYRVPATNKFYVCVEAYNGTQITAPNANFVELSVWKNHDRLSNLVGFYIFNDAIFEISMNLLTIVTFNTSKNQNEVLLNLNKIFKNRKKGQRLLIMINTVSSLKPNITEFFYNGEPGDITSQSEYWSAKQTNRRYDSIEFIVGSDKNFYLIANNGFTIIKK